MIVLVEPSEQTIAEHLENKLLSERVLNYPAHDYESIFILLDESDVCAMLPVRKEQVRHIIHLSDNVIAIMKRPVKRQSWWEFVRRIIFGIR